MSDSVEKIEKRINFLKHMKKENKIKFVDPLIKRNIDELSLIKKLKL